MATAAAKKSLLFTNDTLDALHQLGSDHSENKQKPQDPQGAKTRGNTRKCNRGSSQGDTEKTAASKLSGGVKLAAI